MNCSIKVRNYKCFEEPVEGFTRILPLNIIIGKNNSGKSSLIDIIEFVVNPSQTFFEIGRDNIKSEVQISDFITETHINGLFQQGMSGGGIPGSNHYEYGMSLVNSRITFTYAHDGSAKIIDWEKPIVPNSQDYERRLEKKIKSPFYGKTFKRLNAERDVKPQGADQVNLKIESDGNGATNLIRRIINEVKYGDRNHNPDLIKSKLLENLNLIVNPEITIIDILPRFNPDNNWEIYFKDGNNTLIALSKMGSGIKTILLVLLNLLVIPEIENIKKENLVFGFEELENNLHPSLQRKLFNFIIEYAKENGTHFFITTHSSIVIDIFGQIEDAQIIHVLNNGSKSIVNTIESKIDGRNVLKDLDYKPSDILLSNGVIWVEGPSDAIYIKLFLDLYKNQVNFPKKLNYCIQSFSTALWKYAGFDDFTWDKIDQQAEDNIISLAKIHHNHLIVLDNDGNYENKRPSEFEKFNDSIGKIKARLIHKLMRFENINEELLETNYGDSKTGKLFFWVNDGTIETYLEHFIYHEGARFKKYFDLKCNRGFFEKKRNGVNYSKSKVELATEILNYSSSMNIGFDSFAPKDSSLFVKIRNLFETIKSWNQ